MVEDGMLPLCRGGAVSKQQQRKPEMEVTEIILAKVSRLCQLSPVSSHRRGFLSDLRFINP
jgi:hypothetical protein